LFTQGAGILRTQVGIVGAGPAGLTLAHLLHLEGIDAVVLESRSRDYIENRLRAGLLEQGTADLMVETGVGARLQREAIYHDGLFIKFQGLMKRIDFADLVGQQVMIYAQQEIVKDLVAARLGYDEPLQFEVSDVRLDGLKTDAPRIDYTHDSAAQSLECDFIAGCDGFHGISRPSIPSGDITLYERIYPFSWLGILTEAPSTERELVYTHHERGFCLLTQRTHEIQRLYLQCAIDEKIENWSDDRIWEEFRLRCEGEGNRLREGPITQKGITEMRSFVAAPMQYGRLFLAGDSAHIVPPTGAKGLNLAVADVRVLARALVAFYKDGRSDLLEAYSRVCLRRVWKVQRFSWWVTQLLHRFDDDNDFDIQRQLAEIDYITSSRAGATTWAENYVGLPMEWD
jgi:p-hydroxybenzoate 3-monooxygenase